MKVEWVRIMGLRGLSVSLIKKGVLKSATWMDNPLTYAPYGNKLNILRKFLK